MSIKSKALMLAAGVSLTLASANAAAWSGDVLSDGKFDFYVKETPSNDYVYVGLASTGLTFFTYAGGVDSRLDLAKVDYLTSAGGDVSANLFGKSVQVYHETAIANMWRDLDTDTGSPRLVTTRELESKLKYLGNVVKSYSSTTNTSTKSLSHTVASVTFASGEVTLYGITFRGRLRGNLYLNSSVRASGPSSYASIPFTDTVASKAYTSADVEAYGSATVLGIIGPYGKLRLVDGSLGHRSQIARTVEEHIGFGVTEHSVKATISSPATLKFFGGELGLATLFGDKKLVSWGAPISISTRLNPTYTFTESGFQGFI